MLISRWLELCDAVQVDGPRGWQEITTAYGANSRAYHNMDHIEDCLTKFDSHAHLATDASAIEFAIWFHDIVYDTRAHDNEEQSALLASQFLSRTPLAQTVSDLIIATKHDLRRRSRDADLICDIDLSLLGRDGAGYDAYADAIREEFAWVPAVDYAIGRRQFLEGVLARQVIFTTRELSEIFEEQARINLTRELAWLG